MFYESYIQSFGCIVSTYDQKKFVGRKEEHEEQ